MGLLACRGLKLAGGSADVAAALHIGWHIGPQEKK